MQKRTRIFAAVTVLAGLLLGLAALLMTFGAGAPANAANTRHRHHGGGHTQTVTNTVSNTVTNTVTQGPPPPPAPACTSTPNPALHLGSVPGEVQFDIVCSNLPKNTLVEIESNLQCAVVSTTPPGIFGVSAIDYFTTVGVPIAGTGVVTDSLGNLNISVEGEGCNSGNFTFTVSPFGFPGVTLATFTEGIR